LRKKIKDVEEQIDNLTKNDNDVRNLLTIRGIGPFSPALIKAEIIDIKRFRVFNRLSAYAGLAPRVKASANRIYHGPLNKNRRKNLQWILIENVFHYIKSLIKTQNKFNRIKKQKRHNTAKVVLSRDMLKIIYHILKEKRQYYRVKREIQNTKKQIQSVAAATLYGV